MATTNPIVRTFAGLVYYQHMELTAVPVHLQTAVTTEVVTYGEDPYFDDHRHTMADVDELTTTLTGKVDKVAGKGLSTNDYTTVEKEKLTSLKNFSGSYTDLIDKPAAPTATDIPTAAGTTVEEELTSLKQSGSDAKTLIATAITAKGVEASSSDTFAVLTDKITAIPEGAQIENGILPVGSFDIVAPFTIDFLVLLAEQNEVVTFAPAAYRGFGTGNGYEFIQGRLTCTFNGSTATLAGAALDAPVSWVAIGE